MKMYNRIREGYIANSLAVRNAEVNPTMSASNLNIFFSFSTANVKRSPFWHSAAI